MSTEDLKYDVTPIALEYFRQRSFEIIFDVFNSMNSCDDEKVKEYILEIGNEEFYESLKYHNDLLYSVLLTRNYELIKDFFSWKYSVYLNRNIDVDCFLLEYEYWKQSLNKHLYLAHSSEISLVYDFLIAKHQEFKNSNLGKFFRVKEQYKTLFEELLAFLLNGNREKFFALIKDNLFKFEDNIFLLVEELINPLMYEIGQLWQLNKISVAKEHLSTSLIDEAINELIKNRCIPNENKLVAITSTVGNELHNLGIKIVGKFLESCGYDVKNLSSKISNRDIINSIYDIKPQLVILSITLPANVATLQEIVKELKSDYNLFSGTIIVGGQGLFGTHKEVNIKNADFHCKSLEALKEFLQK